MSFGLNITFQMTFAAITAFRFSGSSFASDAASVILILPDLAAAISCSSPVFMTCSTFETVPSDLPDALAIAARALIDLDSLDEIGFDNIVKPDSDETLSLSVQNIVFRAFALFDAFNCYGTLGWFKRSQLHCIRHIDGSSHH